MKGIIAAALAALATSALLAGCAAGGAQTAMADADAGYTPVGTNIPRKQPNAADNVTHVDKQALENERMMGNGTINPPGK